MRNICASIAAARTFLFGSLLALSTLLGLSAPVSAALVEYAGSNTVIGNDGVSRNVSVWMIFDNVFNKNPGTPPPVPGPVSEGSFGYFKIISYTVNVPGVGVFADTNGRLDIWWKRNPTSFGYYTEELEVLEDHGLMKFQDGAGNPWSWAPWLASPAAFALPPELMIPVLNISPGYGFSWGNEIHLFPVCRCKGGSCTPPKT
jgi:hypothetical protein